MSVETNVLDIKKAQRQELLLEEAAKRANAVKAYEILPANKIQLPAPELLVDQIRIKPGQNVDSNTEGSKVDNNNNVQDSMVRIRKGESIVTMLRSKEINGKIAQDDVIAKLDLEARAKALKARAKAWLDPLPILPKAMDAWCKEQSHLENLTLESKLNAESWTIDQKRLATIQREIKELESKAETTTTSSNSESGAGATETFPHPPVNTLKRPANWG